MLCTTWTPRSPASHSRPNAANGVCRSFLDQDTPLRLCLRWIRSQGNNYSVTTRIDSTQHAAILKFKENHSSLCSCTAQDVINQLPVLIPLAIHSTYYKKCRITAVESRMIGKIPKSRLQAPTSKQPQQAHAGQNRRQFLPCRYGHTRCKFNNSDYSAS